MNIEWHPEAAAEFDADVNWYGSRDSGSGDRFEAVVLVAVEAAAEDPGAWPTWPGWDREPVVRSKGVSGFPYRVAYFVEGDVVTIVAVVHAKRRPGYWRARVSL